MSDFVVTNIAGNNVANTENVFIELVPPANVSIFLKKIRVAYGGTGAGDNPVDIFVRRESTLGSGGVSATAKSMNTSSASSVTSVNVKTGTTAFTLGTIVDTVLHTCFFVTRGTFEWIPRDKDDYIWSDAGQALAITLNSTNIAVSNLVMECFFGE
ncbi:MAG TPA: hypothetical protein VEV83_15390 [Parafilimonas sp.]|nr:hypothetical protein [Parafilimonas sp.]